jgi:hypothetical protein
MLECPECHDHAGDRCCPECNERGWIPNPAVIARLAALEAENERLRTALVDERVRAACVAAVVLLERGICSTVGPFDVAISDLIIQGYCPKQLPVFSGFTRAFAERSLAPILDPNPSEST